VQGSRAKPYEVTVRVDPADTFDSLRALVPEPEEVSFQCSCPDWDDPCKHGVAVMLAFAEVVVDDPEMLRLWRGKAPRGAGERAVIGSRTGLASVPKPAADGPTTLDPAAAAALGEFLGERVEYAVGQVSRLAAPNAAWGELWAEMLADALDKLADNN